MGASLIANVRHTTKNDDKGTTVYKPLEYWQFGEFEYHPPAPMKPVVDTLPATVSQRLGEKGTKLMKMLRGLQHATQSYMNDNGHGPDHVNSVQKLSGFAYIDFDRSQDLMDFLYPREPGTSLLALGSFGAAFGKTRTSYTGTVIERALTNAPSYDLLFLDILNVYVDKVEDFKGSKGGRLYKSVKCMAKQTFQVLQDAVGKVLVEICQLRLKLNPQASIVLLPLGPSILKVWEPIVKHCLKLFERPDGNNDIRRLILHGTMRFHPSAMYTKSGKSDGSYQAAQLKEFFGDMTHLAAKLECVDVMGHFKLSNIQKNIAEGHSRSTHNEKMVIELLELHGLNPTTVLEKMPSYFYIDNDVLTELVSFFTPNTQALRALMLSRWWMRRDLDPVELSSYPDIVNQVGTKRANDLTNELGFYCRKASRSFHICLAHLVDIIGDENAASLFSTTSFLARIGVNVAFTDLFYGMMDKNPEDAIRLFSTNSFSARIGDDAKFAALFYGMMDKNPEDAIRLFSTNSFSARIGDDCEFRRIFQKMYRNDSKGTIQLFRCTPFASRVTDDEGFLSEFKDMSRTDPVMALRFFKTGCFLVRYFNIDDGHIFRKFVGEMVESDKEVWLSLLTKNHFAKRIKKDVSFDRVFDDLKTLGMQFNVPFDTWSKIMKCTALIKVMLPLMKRIPAVNSASSFQRLIESFSGRYETVVKRHT